MPAKDPTALADQLEALALKQVETHALVLLDPQGVVVGWKAGAEQLFGYTAEEIIGQNVSILFVPEDVEKGLSLWEQKTASVAPDSEDDRWQLRKDGARIWVSGTLTALRDDAGNLVGFAKIMRNHTDQKLQVEALERQMAACEQRQLSKNTFISTLAHELRSPLAALSSAADLLQMWASNDPDKDLTIGIVRRQVDFMSRMADDLMELTRTAMGKAKLHRQQTVLQELLDLAIETTRPAIDDQQQTLERLLPDAPVQLQADPERLRQVFVNLIQNASKYTNRGGTIWVKGTVEGDEAVIRVQDNGIGIAPEVMPHIFDLFTQAEPSTRSHGGLGIGLSVVKDNVALHGGTVQGASDGLGKGSEFTVRLPLKGRPG